MRHAVHPAAQLQWGPPRASRLQVKPAPYSTLLITENLPNLVSWTILCHQYTLVGLLRSFCLLASALPVCIQLWPQDIRPESAAESAAQHCSRDTRACPGESCKCTSSTHTHGLTCCRAPGTRHGPAATQTAAPGSREQEKAEKPAAW